MILALRTLGRISLNLADLDPWISRRNWSIMGLRIGRRNIAIANMYLDPYDEGEAVATCRGVSHATWNLGCPVLVCADWNRPQEEVAAKGWPMVDRVAS